MLRALGAWLPRTAPTWQTQDSATAVLLGISHSRKRFQTKCLAIYNSAFRSTVALYEAVDGGEPKLILLITSCCR